MKSKPKPFIFTSDSYEQFLSMPCDDVDPTDPDLIDLITDMYSIVKGIGVGLAANQIGQRKAVAIMQLDGLAEHQGETSFMTTCIMPNILYPVTNKTNQIYVTEGCLSIPGKQFLVPRYENITLTYFDIDGQIHQKKLKGLAAVVAQHEVDHISGKLISKSGKAIVPAKINSTNIISNSSIEKENINE